MEKVIEHWCNMVQNDLGSFTDIKRVKELLYILNNANQLKYFEIKDTGIFAYLIVDDFRGGKSLAELLFYIKPEHRGSIKLVKKYIKKAERIAIDNKCKCVKIGANIGYKDSGFIKLLRRWGYEDDTVSKILGG